MNNPITKAAAKQVTTDAGKLNPNPEVPPSAEAQEEAEVTRDISGSLKSHETFANTQAPPMGNPINGRRWKLRSVPCSYCFASGKSFWAADGVIFASNEAEEKELEAAANAGCIVELKTASTEQ